MHIKDKIVAHLLLIVTVLVVLLFLITQSVIVFASIPKAPYFWIDPREGGAGTLVRFSGNDFLKNTNYTIKFEQTTIASGQTDINGQFRIIQPIPQSQSSGLKVITLTVGSGEPLYEYFSYLSTYLSVFPAEGRIGSAIRISGMYFPPNTAFTVDIEGLYIDSFTTLSNGSFVKYITIPSGFSPGDKTITLISGSLEEQADFKLLSGEVSIEPVSGTVGTEVTVKGFGFNYNADVWIYYRNSIIASTKSDYSGNITASFIIPTSPAGLSDISVKDQFNNSSKNKKFKITPRIQTFSPDQGIVGSSISITGDGFNADATMSLTLEGANWIQSNVKSDYLGSFSGSFEILDIAGGETGRRIIAEDSNGLYVVSDTYFFIRPSVLVAGMGNGQVGTSFTIQGKGFFPEEENILLFFADLLLGTVQCNQDGSFDYTGIMPEMPSGQYQITAKDSRGNVISASPTSSILTIKQNVVIEPNTGHIGIQIYVTGTGFKPNANITLSWDSTNTSETISKSNGIGSFSGTFTVPASKSGSHNVVISDGTNKMNVTWVMESYPPPIPILIYPASGASIGHTDGQMPTFTWKAVEDSSGAYYRMEIATDEQFNNIILTKGYISTNNYTLIQSEALNKGSYFWRVKAIDGAGNEGEWTSPFAIDIGSNLITSILAISIPVLLICAAAAYYYIFGFTKKQKSKKKETREKKKVEKEARRNAEKERQQYLQGLREQILVLARQNRGGLKREFIKHNLKIDDAILELCLQKMKLQNYKKEDTDVFFKDLQIESKKKLK